MQRGCSNGIEAIAHDFSRKSQKLGSSGLEKHVVTLEEKTRFHCVRDFLESTIARAAAGPSTALLHLNLPDLDV
jgi:hypothetical protein